MSSRNIIPFSAFRFNCSVPFALPLWAFFSSKQLLPFPHKPKNGKVDHATRRICVFAPVAVFHISIAHRCP